MAILENFFALILMGVALLAQVPLFTSLLVFLLCLTGGIAYAVFRLRRAKPRSYVSTLRRALTVLAAVLAVLALPGFFLACRGIMNEICLFLAAPFLGGSVIVLALALALRVTEGLRHQKRPETAQASLPNTPPRT